MPHTRWHNHSVSMGRVTTKVTARCVLWAAVVCLAVLAVHDAGSRFTVGFELAHAQGPWPNHEPPGMTTVLAVDGSSKIFGPTPRWFYGAKWLDDTRVFVVGDPDSKFGNAIQKSFFIGDQSGWNGIAAVNDWDRVGGPFRTLYQRVVFRYSPNWQFHSGGGKHIYWGGAGRPSSQSPTQFILGPRGSQVRFVNQSASGESDAQGHFIANGFSLARDVYHTLEVRHVANTPGSSDGSLTMWINGVQVDSFNHLGHPDRNEVQLTNLRWLDYDEPRLEGLQGVEFWGGQNDTKEVDDWIRYAEVYVSGSNDGGGNGDTTVSNVSSTALAELECLVAEDDHVWVNQDFDAQAGTFTAEFDATVSTSPTEALIGFSDGGAGAYGDLATIVRFHNDGNIDARNGSVYEADLVLPYSANTSYHFRLEVDVGAHTYSIFVTPEGGSEQTLATAYAFRTDQASVTRLDNVSSLIDTGFSGSVSTCNLTITGDGGGGDTTPPSVSITAPTDGASVSGAVSVTADASDDVGVVGVQFTLNGANLGAEDTTAPYSASWDTSAVSDGAYTVTAVARDEAGNSATSAPIGVTVDNGTPPDLVPTVLLHEPFEDDDFADRGWYDNTSYEVSTEDHARARGHASLRLHWDEDAITPNGGPMRRLFEETESLYIAYWVKYSSNWVGSQRPYHPHEFQALTNVDSMWLGPSSTHLTVYVEQNYKDGQGNRPRLGMQDAQNIDPDQVGADLTRITEERAVAGCNGNTDGYPTECFWAGTEYRNGKWFNADGLFTDAPGPSYKGRWNRVEAYFRLNSIHDGIGIPDGVVRYWLNGTLILDRTDVLFRTDTHPDMAFNQFLLGPWIGDGSPVSQTMWVDELVVADCRLSHTWRRCR